MKKWYEGIYRRQLTDMHINDTDERFLSRFDADEYYQNLVRAKIQSPMIYLQSHIGLCNYPTESARAHRKFAGGENEIKRLISKCRDGGMKVVGYYSLIYNNYAAEVHPTWQMRYQNGDTFGDRGERYGLCCPNNSEYRRFVKLQIDEIAGEFKNLDGIFYDMPFWTFCCYCDSCKERFRGEFGIDIPSEDLSSPEFRKFMRARQDWMVDFVRFVREYTNLKMPSVTVEFNYAAVIGCDWIGGSTEGINAECEFTGGDLYGDLYSHSFACKYYYGVTKNQPFEYMTCRCDSTLREHTITKPLEKLKSEILLTAAHHGASLIIDAIDPIGTLDSRVYDTVGEAFSHQIPYEPYMNMGRLYAEAAVYFDSKTMFSPRGDDRYNRTSAIGAVTKLIEAHIPTAVISNGNMEDLQKYDIIIAPSLGEFDNDEPLKLIDYVKNGGVLYLSGRSDPRLISELLGAKVIGETYQDSKYPWVQQGARVYISPTEGRSIGQFTPEYPMPLTYNLPLLSGVRGEVLATVTLPYANPDENTRFASIHSCPPWENTDFPAYVEAKYGQGKVIWIAAEPEYDNREEFSSIFKDIVKQNVRGKYECKTSRSVELVVFEGDSILFSLCDLKQDEYKSLSDVEMSIKVNVSPNSIKEIATGEMIPFTYDGEKTHFTLSIKNFAMFELKFDTGVMI